MFWKGSAVRLHRAVRQKAEGSTIMAAACPLDPTILGFNWLDQMIMAENSWRTNWYLHECGVWRFTWALCQTTQEGHFSGVLHGLHGCPSYKEAFGLKALKLLIFKAFEIFRNKVTEQRPFSSSSFEGVVLQLLQPFSLPPAWAHDFHSFMQWARAFPLDLEPKNGNCEVWNFLEPMMPERPEG